MTTLRISDPVFRTVVLALAAIAVLSFAYNEVAQARAIRYRPLQGDARLAIDTWGDRICLLHGPCYPIVRTSAAPVERSSTPTPPALDTGFKMDTTR